MLDVNLTNDFIEATDRIREAARLGEIKRWRVIPGTYTTYYNKTQNRKFGLSSKQMSLNVWVGWWILLSILCYNAGFAGCVWFWPSLLPIVYIWSFPTCQCSKEVLNCIVLAWIWFIAEYNLTSSHTQFNSIWVNIWSLIRTLYEIETDITLQLLQLEFKYSLSSHIFKPKLKFSLFAQVLSPGILA